MLFIIRIWICHNQALGCICTGAPFVRVLNIYIYSLATIKNEAGCRCCLEIPTLISLRAKKKTKKNFRVYRFSDNLCFFYKLEFFKLNFALVLPILLEATSLHRKDFSKISKVIYSRFQRLFTTRITKVQFSSLFHCFLDLLGTPFTNYTPF